MKNCNVKTNHDIANWYDLEIQKMESHIFDLNLAKPALRALVNAGIYSVEKLNNSTLEDLKKLHGMGPSAIQKLVVFLKK